MIEPQIPNKHNISKIAEYKEEKYKNRIYKHIEKKTLELLEY